MPAQKSGMMAARRNHMEIATSWIEQTPGRLGGSACIRDTRIPVWQLVEARGLGQGDADLLHAHPTLTTADLETAWEYAKDHPTEINQALWRNQVCMLEHSGSVPAWLLVQGRRLGLDDEEIRTSFQPSLPSSVLAAAWVYEREHAEEITRALQAAQE
jgi:uncharacterized protein (DUF433 family)